MQVVTRLGSVYRVRLPADVSKPLQLLDLIALVPDHAHGLFACMGLGDFDARLLVAALFPLALIVLAPLPSFAFGLAVERRSTAKSTTSRDWCRRVISRTKWTTISIWLPVLYFAYPITACLSFLAFDCETFVDALGAHKFLRSARTHLAPCARAAHLFTGRVARRITTSSAQTKGATLSSLPSLPCALSRRWSFLARCCFCCLLAVMRYLLGVPRR